MASKIIEFSELDLNYNMDERFSINTRDNFLDEIKAINKLPFSEGEFYFSDDIWDFSPYLKTNIPKYKAKFPFDNIVECYRDATKYFVLMKILENKQKLQSIFENLRKIKVFLNAANNNSYYSVQDIEADFVIEYINGLGTDPIFKNQVKSGIRNFMEFYDINVYNFFTNELSEALKTEKSRATAILSNSRKLPDIPKDYFDLLIQNTIRIINSSDPLDKPYKGVACVLLILSQTGLRIGEILDLLVNSISPVKIFNGQEAFYLNYRTWKREKGKYSYSYEKTYINTITEMAINKLTDIYDEKRKALGVEYLFLGGNWTEKSDYPVDSDGFYRLLMKYYIYINKYFPVINVQADKYPGLKEYKISNLLGPGKGRSNEGLILVHPVTEQYRVHVCTELYNKGVPLQYIKRFMGHLSHEMEGYYVRTTADNPQEDMAFAMTTFRQIINGEIEPLGGTSDLVVKIEEFIKEGKYNVASDLTEICQELSKRIPVRQKTGGTCIKSSLLRECSVDSKTNEFYCAYSVCPNIYHFYYMVNTSYNQARELLRSISINKENGHLRQSQKESNMLQTIISNRLLPELDSLKRIAERDGAEAVLQRHPELIHIIKDFCSVYEEVNQWKVLKI